MRQFLERNAHMISWISGIGIPGALIFVGWLALGSVERSKLDSEYVRIALIVLSAKPTGKPDESGMPVPTAEEMALRRWAVRLLNAKSPEKFLSEERDALMKGPAPLGGNVPASNPTAQAAPDVETFKRSMFDTHGPVYALDQTVVADASRSAHPPFIHLNILRPQSRSFSPTDLTVKVLSVPPENSAFIQRPWGPPVLPGEILSVSDLQELVAVDRTGGGGGKGTMTYRVTDPDGRTDDAAVTVILNPVPKQ